MRYFSGAAVVRTAAVDDYVRAVLVNVAPVIKSVRNKIKA